MIRRRWLVGVLVLGLLCLAASFSSRAPDAVQKLVGLPGGAESFLKAVGGVLVTASVFFILGSLLTRFRGKP